MQIVVPKHFTDFRIHEVLGFVLLSEPLNSASQILSIQLQA